MTACAVFSRRSFLQGALAGATAALAARTLCGAPVARVPYVPAALGPFRRGLVPEPVLPAEPGFLDLYWKAWELTWAHVVASPGAPQSPYLDEAANPNKIWIWDTCFMALFSRYAAGALPGIESLDNFYVPMHGGVGSPLAIHHWDNPPLFAWIEWEHFQHTGDVKRLRWLLEEKQYLQRHYDFFERAAELTPPGGMQAFARRDGPGYLWSGNPSGMDNTPRGAGDYASILWVDAIAQQALSAECIARLARVIGREDIATEFAARYRAQSETINRYYWDKDDGFYYDIGVTAPHRFCRVRTPASYWPMLAGISDAAQAEAMHRRALDPEWFGGPIPWPTVDRSSPYFTASGNYWRGSVWLPTAYMGIKALERYGYQDTARTMATAVIRQMDATYREFSPATIWECYSPTANSPATKPDGRGLVRRDFCGWSALGPISLLIENVLGFERIDATARQVHWTKTRRDSHGIRRLRFGAVTTSIAATDDTVEVDSTAAYTLVINRREYRVSPGHQIIRAESRA